LLKQQEATELWEFPLWWGTEFVRRSRPSPRRCGNQRTTDAGPFTWEFRSDFGIASCPFGADRKLREVSPTHLELGLQSTAR